MHCVLRPNMILRKGLRMDNTTYLKILRAAGYKIFEASARHLGETWYVLAELADENWLLIIGKADTAFSGKLEKAGELIFMRCDLNHENCCALKLRFPYTAPVSLKGKKKSIGLGDRLGLVTGAQLKALEGTDFFPVLAQQSTRELTLTGRTNRNMMDEVAWQVFQAGYEGGYAADGDHRKTQKEVHDALEDGVTMLTLDCSEHIDDKAYLLDILTAEALCSERFSHEELTLWKKLYCGKSFPAQGGYQVFFEPSEFFQMLLTYGKALEFAERIYSQEIKACTHEVSFEISIDETDIPTKPCAHYFVAAELARRGVLVDSIAPRFCGEFQKGIDYIGNIERFQEEFARHAAIAREFHSRISVHSGSDKFSIFPIVSKLSKGEFHIKTSGTSWVEAVRVIAKCDPALFRRMLHVACGHFEEAKKYYHVTADLNRVLNPDGAADECLPDFLDQTDTRQVLHITYGFLLQVERENIYRTLHEHRDVLEKMLSSHILRHVNLLS